jgi:uncharacterized protein YjbJ (UPF0337 family)
MADQDDEPDDEPTEAPATWENIAAAKVKEAVGHLLHDKDLIEEGEEQEEAAHEVREEYKGEQGD